VAPAVARVQNPTLAENEWPVVRRVPDDQVARRPERYGGPSEHLRAIVDTMGRNECTRAKYLLRALTASTVLLVATGCGGASDSDSETTESATSDSATRESATPPSNGAVITSDVVAAASNRIGDHHGERLGFAVTVVALDSGYSIEQIVESPTPNADGSIEGVQPAGPPLGVLSAPAAPGGLRRPAQPDNHRLAIFG